MHIQALPPMRLQNMNTLVLACMLLWFAAQQNLLSPTSLKYGPVDVAKAMHLQPRIPPPLLDPEQVDIGFEETETIGDHWPRF